LVIFIQFYVYEFEFSFSSQRIDVENVIIFKKYNICNFLLFFTSLITSQKLFIDSVVCFFNVVVLQVF